MCRSMRIAAGRSRARAGSSASTTISRDSGAHRGPADARGSAAASASSQSCSTRESRYPSPPAGTAAKKSAGVEGAARSASPAAASCRARQRQRRRPVDQRGRQLRRGTAGRRRSAARNPRRRRRAAADRRSRRRRRRRRPRDAARPAIDAWNTAAWSGDAVEVGEERLTVRRLERGRARRWPPPAAPPPPRSRSRRGPGSVRVANRAPRRAGTRPGYRARRDRRPCSTNTSSRHRPRSTLPDHARVEPPTVGSHRRRRPRTVGQHVGQAELERPRTAAAW